jgi:hypothetical protein
MTLVSTIADPSTNPLRLGATGPSSTGTKTETLLIPNDTIVLAATAKSSH